MTNPTKPNAAPEMPAHLYVFPPDQDGWYSASETPSVADVNDTSRVYEREDVVEQLRARNDLLEELAQRTAALYDGRLANELLQSNGSSDPFCRAERLVKEQLIACGFELLAPETKVGEQPAEAEGTGR